MTGGYLPAGMQPSGELTSRTPTLEERTVDWLRKLLFTDDREGTAKAERLTNVLGMTPPGMALDAYNIGKAGAEGNATDLLQSMILTVPGVSKSTAEELFKMRGNRDLLEMFNKTGYWLDPNYSVPKTMIGPDGKKDLFTQRFYEEINRLKRSPGDKIEKYIDLDAISQDPTLANVDFRVVPGVSTFGSGTEGVYKGALSQAIVFPDHIRANMPNKSERDQLNQVKGISLHELTHGSQDKAGAMDSTSDKYYDNFLKEALLGPSGNQSKIFNLRDDDINKLIDIDEALPNIAFKNNVNNTTFNADLTKNEHGVTDFLAYWLHPNEREARASEDMLTKPLNDRLTAYLKGVDSMPPKHPYKSTISLIDTLYKALVTGELDVSQHVARKPMP